MLTSIVLQYMHSMPSCIISSRTLNVTSTAAGLYCTVQKLNAYACKALLGYFRLDLIIRPKIICIAPARPLVRKSFEVAASWSQIIPLHRSKREVVLRTD